MAMAFAMAAEIERDLISQRTKEALAARKKNGMTLGRPRGVGKSKLDQYRPEI
jgi:DNA invertase Pin-like site-specific DNA recombinase